MKKLMLVVLAGLVTMSAVAIAQNQKSNVSAKIFTMSGTVGDDGKTLVSDQNDEWVVSNADTLKQQEGRRVTVRCRLESDKLIIHVISFKLDEVKYSASRGDSAYRR